MNKAFAFFLVGLVGTSALAEDVGKRQVLTIIDPQRGHVLEEMRALLAGTQQVLAALSKDDMAAVAQFAHPLGMGMAHKAEDHFKGALSNEFMQPGRSVHQDFDQIATEAESIKDPKRTLRQLSDSMSECGADPVRCQIRSVPRLLNPIDQTKHHEHQV